MIRHAKISEITDILAITKACAHAMEQKGIYQWNEYYPSREAFEKDLKREELYVLEKEGAVIGTVVISTLMDAEYIPIQWSTPNENNIYIHRLSVHPDHQRKGYARELMDFAEAFAKEHRFNAIRLDTFSMNKKNQLFYETRGYQKLGDIYFPKQSTAPFHCYELILA